uniref:MADF domain-containing protein n=1 Tax=Meloidogyne hapla TaxID=6305 RepID=A0A1I8BF87_MELHA
MGEQMIRLLGDTGKMDRIPRPTFTRPNSKKSGTAKNQTKSVNEHNYECCLFTTEQREAFINAIRERSIIWGYSPCTFKDFQERRAAFIEVAEIISNEKSKYSGPEMQYMWNLLRNTFLKNLRKVIANGGDYSKITWRYWKNGFKKLNGYISVKTRNSTSFPINCATNFDSSDNQHISQIDKWKKISRYFTNCAQKDICDPFGIFDANEDNICFSCLEIRDNLREKSILMWDAEQLEQKLCDYAYFHAIKIFNPNAEYQFANTKSKHPYFLAYENIRQQIKIILKNISSVFNFPSEIQSAARRTFMTQTRNTQQTLKISPYCKPNNFLVCHRHARLFSVYYRLLHMDWNIHWNCYLRISQIQKRLPNLNASNVINAVDPQIFLDISKEYFSLFKVLDELVYLKNNRHVVCGISDSLIEGFHSWDKIKVFIKDIGILKRIEEEK